MTTYVSNNYNPTINPIYGYMYLAEHNIDKIKNYVLFCKHNDVECFVFLELGVILSAEVFYKNHKLVNHIEEVIFKY